MNQCPILSIDWSELLSTFRALQRSASYRAFQLARFLPRLEMKGRIPNQVPRMQYY